MRKMRRRRQRCPVRERLAGFRVRSAPPSPFGGFKGVENGAIGLFALLHPVCCLK